MFTYEIFRHITQLKQDIQHTHITIELNWVVYIYLALHWLQENAAEFGGDPGSVTLMGHGTGAACATFLMTSPAVPDGKFDLFSYFFFDFSVYLEYSLEILLGYKCELAMKIDIL